MGVCAVMECNNNTEKKVSINTGFHAFPKEKTLLKQWIHFCKRKDKFNPTTARVCSLHFLKEDFTNNLKYEMGFVQSRTLKKGAVPTLRTTFPDPETHVKSMSSRAKRMIESKKTDIITSLLEEPIATESLFNDDPCTEPIDEEVCEKRDLQNESQSSDKLKEEIDALKKKISDLEKDNFVLRLAEKDFKKEIQALNLKLTKSEYEMSNIEIKLQEIFTSGQIRKLKNGQKRINWTEEDIAKSITLYSASSRAYKLLKKKQFPLPAVRTLQRWAEKIQISPGILKPVIRIMKAATHLSETQKICVLSFDEMKVKKAYCYDKSSDTTLPPASYVQVAMLRGLVGKWKQPIFYEFDCKMTKQILFEIIETVQNCGYTIVAITSDLGGSNRALYNELDISMIKPWFVFDNEKVFVFADVPHLIKLLRNHFIDHGYMINGKKVTKEIILKLLTLTSSELSITHKISTQHLSVIKAERQKVKLATKLFSHSVAKSLSRAVSLGLIQDESWEESYNLIKLTNDWFDVLNIKEPYADSRERVQAYGLHLEIQNSILDQMTDLVQNMRAIGKNALLPFQKGIVQSNTALKALGEDLNRRFGIKYLLTYRLNQDVLENFFGVIRAKGGIHDHPDRQEFKFRLRSYILGFNEGALSNSGNVSEDDTPDLNLQDKNLTGTIFQTIRVPKQIEECETEPEINLDMAYDGLENLAGYICHKMKNSFPDCRVNPEADMSYSWVTHLNEGGLSKPTNEMMADMAALDAVFISVNGEELKLKKDYLKYMIDLSESTYCDGKIKKLFFKTRMYFRIRKLNREIYENNTLKKRKYKKITT